jgi:hypothetical protein
MSWCDRRGQADRFRQPQMFGIDLRSRARINARWITFSSSRMLPGHPYCVNRRTAAWDKDFAPEEVQVP